MVCPFYCAATPLWFLGKITKDTKSDYQTIIEKNRKTVRHYMESRSSQNANGHYAYKLTCTSSNCTFSARPQPPRQIEMVRPPPCHLQLHLCIFSSGRGILGGRNTKSETPSTQVNGLHGLRNANPVCGSSISNAVPCWWLMCAYPSPRQTNPSFLLTGRGKEISWPSGINPTPVAWWKSVWIDHEGLFLTFLSTCRKVPKKVLWALIWARWICNASKLEVIPYIFWR